jgi:hypothetical protein
MHAVNGSAGRLCNGSIEKIGSDGRRRMDAEEEHEQGRHQRTTANAGDTDQRSYDKTGQGIERLERQIRASVDARP